MGRVYLTHDRHLGRFVAVKEANGGAAETAALAREARVLATLEHPGIVALHDAGTTADGRPWIAMRLVRGRTLEDVVAERRSLPERLALLTHFRDACQAVAHAHSQGVVHRDLKPANVLVGAFGETQVVDWGLAVSQAEAAPEFAGTPAWMSPEQARGEAVDRRADVWGLGAVLAYVLTGRAPRDGELASALLAQVEHAVPGPLGARLEGLPPELSAIVGRSLAHDPADRYPDALSLAADVERYLTGARVEAHPYTPAELLVRVVRTWRAPLAVAAVAAVAGLVATVAFTSRLAGERDRAVVAEAAAEQALTDALRTQARQAAAAGALGRAGVLGAAALAGGEHPEARGAVLAARSAWTVERTEVTAVEDCPGAVLLDDGHLCRDPDEVRRVRGPDTLWRASVAALSLMPSGTVIAAQRPTDVVLLDHATGTVLDVHPRRSPLPLVGADDGRFATRRWEGESWWGGLAPDARRPLTSCDGHGVPRESALHPTRALHAAWCADGVVAITDEAGETSTVDLGLPVDQHGDVAALRWARDGRHLALGWYRGRVGWLEVDEGRLHHAPSPSGAGVADVAIAPDGATLGVRRDDGEVELWSTAPLAVVASPPATAVRDLRWIDAHTLRTLDAAGASTWRLHRATAPPVLPMGLGVSTLRFTPSGDAVVAGLSDGVLTSTPVRPEGSAWRTDVGDGVVMSTAFLSDDHTLVVLPGEELVVRTLQVDGRGLRPLATIPGSRAVVPLSGGGLLALGYEPGVWRVEGTQVIDAGCARKEWRSATEPRGDTLLLVAIDGEVAVVRDGRCARSVPGLRATRAALAPDGRSFVAATADGLVRSDLDGRVGWTAKTPTRVLHLAFSADGGRLAAGGVDRLAWVLDATDGRLLATLRGHGHRVSSVAFAPDGGTLATGSWDGTVRLWALDALDASPEALAATWDRHGWPSAAELVAR